MKDYREDIIRDMVKEKLINNINLFYKSAFLNYSGKTLDTKEEYTEVIADELVNNYDRISQPWKNLPIRKTKSFNMSHDGFSNVKSRLKKFGKLEYCEKLLAIALFNSGQTYCLGKILDYEVPLKEKQKPYDLGKIDLVSVDDNTQAVRLIELKIKNKGGTDETLLRAVLEIYTYYKLIKHSESQGKFLQDYDLLDDQQSKPAIKPAILTDKEALSGYTLSHMEKYPRLQALITAMNDEIGEQMEWFVYDYPDRGKPFQGNVQQPKDPYHQIIMLQGNIVITQKKLSKK
jgi:hypothetical protein